VSYSYSSCLENAADRVYPGRATAPDKIGPGNVFPDPSIWNHVTGANNPFKHWEFWLALVCQIIIVVGYFVFFRKEQLVSDDELSFGGFY
jgi:hypothetical protein